MAVLVRKMMIKHHVPYFQTNPYHDMSDMSHPSGNYTMYLSLWQMSLEIHWACHKKSSKKWRVLKHQIEGYPILHFFWLNPNFSIFWWLNSPFPDKASQKPAASPAWKDTSQSSSSSKAFKCTATMLSPPFSSALDVGDLLTKGPCTICVILGGWD